MRLFIEVLLALSAIVFFIKYREQKAIVKGIERLVENDNANR
jgi:hypothetical protein